MYLELRDVKHMAKLPDSKIENCLTNHAAGSGTTTKLFFQVPRKHEISRGSTLQVTYLPKNWIFISHHGALV